MSGKKFFSVLIIIFGLGLFLLAQSHIRETNSKHDLAEWTKVQTDNANKDYSVSLTDVKKLGFEVDQFMSTSGQNYLGDQYALIVEQSAPTHSADTFFCQDAGGGSAIYADASDPKNHLAVSFSYQPSPKGCAYAVDTAVLVKFQEKT